MLTRIGCWETSSAYIGCAIQGQKYNLWLTFDLSGKLKNCTIPDKDPNNPLTTPIYLEGLLSGNPEPAVGRSWVCQQRGSARRMHQVGLRIGGGDCVLCASLHLVSLPSHRVRGAEDRRIEKNLQEGLPGSWGGSEPDFDDEVEDEDELGSPNFG